MSGKDAEPSRYAFLDVARAAAAGMVFLEHTRKETLPSYLDWPLAYFNVGLSGVLLFLVISGFIIPASLERCAHLASFWLRRAFRLLPALYASMLLAVGYLVVAGSTAGLPDLGDLWTWVGNLVLAPDLFRRGYVWGVYWSLRLELIVYAAAAVLAWRGWLRSAAWAALAAPVGVVLLGVIRPLTGSVPYEPNSYRLVFMAACLGLLAYRAHADESLLPALSLATWGTLAAGGLVHLVNGLFYPGHPWWVGLCGYVTTWGTALATFWLLFQMRKAKMPSWACYLGKVSYSIYLCHPFVLLLLASWRGSAAYFPMALLFTVGLSMALYHGVELPGIWAGRCLERWLWPPVAQAEAAAAPRRAA
jgi:peptidoglycan/LPS O-acetylase OafA/YrhL